MVKNLLKEIFALFICMAMVTSVGTYSVFAQEHYTLKVETVEGKAGETVTVPITISEFSTLSGIQGMIEYDGTKMTLVSIAKAELFQQAIESYNETNGRFLIYDNNLALTESGTIAHVTFKLNSDFTGSAEVNLTAEVLNTVNTDGEIVSILDRAVIENGKINLSSGESESSSSKPEENSSESEGTSSKPEESSSKPEESSSEPEGSSSELESSLAESGIESEPENESSELISSQVEESEVSDSSSLKPNTNDSEKGGKNPQTGDNSREIIGIVFIAAILSLILFLFLMLRQKNLLKKK